MRLSFARPTTLITCVLAFMAVASVPYASADVWLGKTKKKRPSTVSSSFVGKPKNYVFKTSSTARAQNQRGNDEVSKVIAKTLYEPTTSGNMVTSALAKADLPANAREAMLLMIEISEVYARNNVSRKTDPNRVRLFQKLSGLTRLSDYYCAAGVCYAGSEALAQLAGAKYQGDPATRLRPFKSKLHRNVSAGKLGFFPVSPLCLAIKSQAVKNQQWIPMSKTDPSDLRAGWLVLFKNRSDNNREVDHVGIVVGTEGAPNKLKSLVTVEYNTGGGRVMLKSYPRYEMRKNIKGFVRTN